MYQRAKDQYLTNGLPPISHGNAKRLPSHGFATVDIRQVTTFLTNYSQANAILLPGRVAMHKRSDVQLLPTHTTKNSVWNSYVKACGTLTFKLASYRTFCRIWQLYKPMLIITTPKSDLCWTCQKNSNAITESANKSVVEKMEVMLLYIMC